MTTVRRLFDPHIGFALGIGLLYTPALIYYGRWWGAALGSALILLHSALLALAGWDPDL